MIDSIFVEQAVRDHPRTREVLQRFPAARVIDCGRYGEIFNPKAQSFRLQKQRPALILAEKFKNFVLPAPMGYGIGAEHNYYFSHLLNCLYDCRYCFLQGMYRSAHYVLFVNYEDFEQEIRRIAAEHNGQPVHFFSGYDCDSLALEPVTGFVGTFLPLFRDLANAWLELRTKSTQTRALANMPPLENCVVAFSFTPAAVAAALEAKTPSLDRRLAAARRLQQLGWSIGLRFDPIIYHEDWPNAYSGLFARVFRELTADRLHSVSLGTFRLPDAFFRRMAGLYPEEPLFAGPLQSDAGMVSYRTSLEKELVEFCASELLRYVPQEKFFPCRP